MGVAGWVCGYRKQQERVERLIDEDDTRLLIGFISL